MQVVDQRNEDDEGCPEWDAEVASEGIGERASLMQNIDQSRTLNDEAEEKETTDVIKPSFRYDLVILMHRYSCHWWDSQTFMDSRGHAVIPLQVFFCQMPAIFLLGTTLGWYFSMYICVKFISTKGFDLHYLIDGITHIVGFSAFSSLLVAKLILATSTHETYMYLPDLWSLWYSYQLSSVELCAPMIIMSALAFRTACFVYEYTISKVVITNISHEFDEQGRFHLLDAKWYRPRTPRYGVKQKLENQVLNRLDAAAAQIGKPQETFSSKTQPYKGMFQGIFSETDMDCLADAGKANAYLHDLQSYVNDINNLMTHDGVGPGEGGLGFLKLPYIDSPDMDVKERGDEYAEEWAEFWFGIGHPLSQTMFSYSLNIPIIIVSLILAGTPPAWMRLTHAEHYLSTPLLTPKLVAVHSFACIFIVAIAMLRSGWAVWTCFRRIRTNVLLSLYLSSTTLSRRHLYRLWGPFGLGQVKISGMTLGNADPVISILDEEELSCEPPESSASDNLKHLVMQTRILAFDEAELKPGHWWKEEHGEVTAERQSFIECLQHIQFHVLDTNRFILLRACMKPEIYVDRARLELCMLGSSMVTVSSLVVVIFDVVYTGPMGAVSCIGMMCLWSFLLSSVFTIVSLHSAVLMNMALNDTAVKVLQQWKARITLIRNEAQRLMNQHADIITSQTRLLVDNKFRSLLEPFDNTIEEIVAEVPLRCIGCAVTPQWRNRVVVGITSLVVGWLGKFSWTFVGKFLSARYS